MKLKRLLALFILIPCILSLSSCFDLGNYQDQATYVDTFDLYAIDENNTLISLEFSDFYNDDAQDFKMPEGFVVSKYKYLALKLKNDLVIGDFYFFVSSDSNVTVECKVNVVSSLPTTFKNLDDDLALLNTYITNHETDPDATLTIPTSEEPTEFLSKSSAKIVNNKFSDIGFTAYKGYDSRLTVASGNYLLVEFVNNTDTGVTFTEETTLEEANTLITQRRENRCNIKFTYFLVESK